MKRLIYASLIIALVGCDDRPRNYVQPQYVVQQPMVVQQPVVVQPDNSAAIVGSAALGYAIGSSMNQPRVVNKTVIVNQTTQVQQRQVQAAPVASQKTTMNASKPLSSTFKPAPPPVTPKVSTTSSSPKMSLSRTFKR